MSGGAIRVQGHADMAESNICYWKTADQGWLIYFPGLGVGSLRKHTVEEHEDGTISVTPSILTSNGMTQRHGYLRIGVWSDG